MSTMLANQLRDMGIMLSLEDSRLRVDSKSGTLTDPIRNLIRANRFELIATLTPEGGDDDAEEIAALSSGKSATVPSYIKRCSACAGTDWELTSAPGVWGCLSCYGLKTIDPSCCPSCGEESLVVEPKAGRVCFRSACRFGKSGRKAESYLDSREPIPAPLMALRPARPQTPDVSSTNPCCPTCGLSVDAPVPCSHLRQLRNDAAQFVEQWRAEKPAKRPRKIAGKPSSA